MQLVHCKWKKKFFQTLEISALISIVYDIGATQEYVEEDIDHAKKIFTANITDICGSLKRSWKNLNIKKEIG